MSHQGILFWESATKEREAQLENYEFRDNFQKLWAVTKKRYILHTLNVMEKSRTSICFIAPISTTVKTLMKFLDHNCDFSQKIFMFHKHYIFSIYFHVS